MQHNTIPHDRVSLVTTSPIIKSTIKTGLNRNGATIDLNRYSAGMSQLGEWRQARYSVTAGISGIYYSNLPDALARFNHIVGGN